MLSRPVLAFGIDEWCYERDTQKVSWRQWVRPATNIGYGGRTDLEKTMIVYRQIQEPLPPGWLPGGHWFIEYYAEDCESGHPMGVAFVTAKNRLAFLDFIFVTDQRRRQGIGTELLLACRRRWPRIECGKGISAAGAGLLRSVSRPRKMARRRPSRG